MDRPTDRKLARPSAGRAQDETLLDDLASGHLAALARLAAGGDAGRRGSADEEAPSQEQAGPCVPAGGADEPTPRLRGDAEDEQPRDGEDEQPPDAFLAGEEITDEELPQAAEELIRKLELLGSGFKTAPGGVPRVAGNPCNTSRQHGLASKPWNPLSGDVGFETASMGSAGGAGARGPQARPAKADGHARAGPQTEGDRFQMPRSTYDGLAGPAGMPDRAAGPVSVRWAIVRLLVAAALAAALSAGLCWLLT